MRRYDVFAVFVFMPPLDDISPSLRHVADAAYLLILFSPYFITLTLIFDFLRALCRHIIAAGAMLRLLLRHA